MDRSRDVLYLDITSTREPLIAFFTLLGQYKELDVRTAELHADRAPALAYRSVQIEGLWPCIWYLLDVRPYPDVLPDPPQKRAIILTLTDRVLAGDHDLNEFMDYYRTPDGSLALKPWLYTLDFAIAAHALDLGYAHQHPWLRTIHDAVITALDHPRENEAHG